MIGQRSLTGKVSLEERLAALLRLFPERRVVVVGDLVADQFLYGEISRVSREAPVLILRHERTETVPGGAANCAVNLAALGARAAIVGVVGDDAPGADLIGRLHAAGVDCRGIVTACALRTTTKVRILAGQTHSTRQQVIRIDYENAPLSDQTTRAAISARLREAVASADAVVISDYNYGVASTEVVTILREAAAEAAVAADGGAGGGRQRPQVLIDSRFRLLEFPGFASATPNEDEVEQLVGRRLTDTAALETAGSELRERLGYPTLLITRGSQGMLLLEEGAAPRHIAAVGSREAIDVTGAGDTVIAAYALALASGASAVDAAHLANHAGGLVVMKRGTASVTPPEILVSITQEGSGVIQ